MAPRLSPNDAADVGLGCAKARCQINLARTFRVEEADHLDLSLREAGVVVAAAEERARIDALSTENLEAVPNVFSASHDFQVSDAIVVSDAVDVIDLHSVRDRADEGSGDKAVNLHIGLSLPAGIEANARVTVLVPVTGELCAPGARDIASARHSVAGPPLNILPLNHPPTPTVYAVGGISAE